MKIGIIGHEAAKFTPTTEANAQFLIGKILGEAMKDRPQESPLPTVVSGACHLGGIDIWAENAADHLGFPKLIHAPKALTWHVGYRPRNLLIAHDSDIVHVIVVREYPENYGGMRFSFCYHCGTSDHIKSGACWTARQALKRGKPAVWHLIDAQGRVDERREVPTVSEGPSLFSGLPEESGSEPAGR